MRIKRYFTHAKSERTGEWGLLPMWIPRSANFDPSELLGVLHDSLDHRLCDRGHPHEEVMAFGRILATRSAWGAGSGQVDGMGAELVSLFMDVYQADSHCYRCMDDMLPVVPRTAPVPDAGLNAYIGAVMESFARSMRRRACGADGWGVDDQLPHDERPTPLFYTKVASLLRIGMMDALRRYNSRMAGNIAYLFDQAGYRERKAREFQSFIGELELADVVRVEIDLDECTVQWAAVPRDYELGRLPEWARVRYSRWLQS